MILAVLCDYIFFKNHVWWIDVQRELSVNE